MPEARTSWLVEYGPLLWLLGSFILVGGLAASVGLRRALWHARVPAGFAIIACFALAGPEQTRFLLAGIDGPGRVLALLVAVHLTGIGAWFWARWSLNLAWQAALPGVEEVCAGWWWRALPRIVAVAPAVAALLCLFLARRMLPLWVALTLLVGLLLVGASLVALAAFRRSVLRGRRARRMGRFLNLEGVLADEALQFRKPQRPVGTRAWLALARACLPFDLPLIRPLLAAFLLAIIGVLIGAEWPSILAQTFGAAPTALFGLAALLTLLAAPVGLVAAAWRWPAMFFLLLLILGAAGVTVNTLVRHAAAPAPARPELAAAAEHWLQHCAVPEGEGAEKAIRAVVVANAGGASRAALWTAAVMEALETQLGLQPGRHLFAISGISGGALGSAAYVATLDQSGLRCGAVQEAAARDARLKRLREGLGQDFLAPPLAGLFLGDGVWRVFGPVSAVAGWAGLWPADRSVRLERAWEAAFAGAGEGGLAAPLLARSLAPDGTLRLPLLLTGGTHQESGRLAVTAPADLRGALPEAIDVIATLGADLPFSVAASNSARFPYVTAPGLLRDREGRRFGQLVDGGYHDNQGAVAARAAAEALAQAHARLLQAGRLAGTRLELFVIQVVSDPDIAREELPRCGPLPPGFQPVVQPAAVAHSRPSPLDFLTSPVGALAAVRGERANGGALEMARRYCGGAGQHFALFALGAGTEGVKPPLSWVLNAAVRRDIAAAGLTGFDRPGSSQENAAELERLARAWQAALQ
ncbi:hypothetical protein JYK14_26020 [Siccirubricoccus sp. KC 17139]|uniref:PNPLA domain-containing protein n=1 Tax=Siccirubricoccus soli TaxID=2899147 RepID=A0ABT1DCC9_9PROT|nr:hypothetical protein [Siccirubricoccus soli]MCO6419596.1 hypothetical protein [Siccirubricoccus soli]MCP2685731.1 hypothetical protein [Siccirubricoccus soli]